VRIIGYAGIDFETVFKNDYPNVYAWAKRMETRPSVVKAYADFS
jgi:glutathione S-transferase